MDVTYLLPVFCMFIFYVIHVSHCIVVEVAGILGPPYVEMGGGGEGELVVGAPSMRHTCFVLVACILHVST
jgi:hypothetical protein